MVKVTILLNLYQCQKVLMSLFHSDSNDLAKQLQGKFDDSSLSPPAPTGVIQTFPVSGETPRDSKEKINCWQAVLFAASRLYFLV